MARVRLEIFDNILTMEKGYVAYIYLRFHIESDFACPEKMTKANFDYWHDSLDSIVSIDEGLSIRDGFQQKREKQRVYTDL